MTVHLIHGFNVRDRGEGTVGRLRPWLPRTAQLWTYGWRGLLGVRLFNRHTAREIARHVKPGDVCIGHSNGCTILQDVADRSPPHTLVYLNPALDRDAPAPTGVRHRYVFHTLSDLPVRLARWLPFHPWGDMGRVGHQGNCHVTQNVDCSRWAHGHSGVFEPEALDLLGPVLQKLTGAVSRQMARGSRLRRSGPPLGPSVLQSLEAA